MTARKSVNSTVRTIKGVEGSRTADETLEEEELYKVTISVVTVRETIRVDYTDITLTTYGQLMNMINKLMDDTHEQHRCINLTGSDGIMHLFTIKHIIYVTPAITKTSN